MIFVPLGIVYAGYTVMYYGASLLRGPGMGFLDLVLPNRWNDADANWHRQYGAGVKATPVGSTGTARIAHPPL